MSSEIFDQDNLKSPKARRFAEAFEGCGEWVSLPSRRGASAPFDFQRHEPDLDFRSRRPSSGRRRLDEAA